LPRGNTGADEPQFCAGVNRIRDHRFERVAENGHRLRKADAVLGQVPALLASRSNSTKSILPQAPGGDLYRGYIVVTAGTQAPIPPEEITGPEFLYFAHNANGQNPVEAANSVTGAYVGPAELGPDFAPALAGDLVTIFASG
jgi:hypothetical protein